MSVTRDPQNGEYAIVIEFKNGGNLGKIIKKNHSNLTWKDIIEILSRISEGLDSIYDSKYYLHSGNILNEIYSDNIIGSVISDFDLDFDEFEFSKDESIKVNEDKSSEFNDDELIRDRKLQIKETFSQKSENKWQAQLAELATNPTLMKRSQNMLT
ncbi:20978_t:CDS:2, partial [Rhizophagus irregularis]